MKRIVIVILLLAVCLSKLYSQTYSPVTVTGFNQDVVADTGTNATAVTSSELDLVFNILYSTTFAATNNLAGGIPANGLISNGGYNFQLENYALNNALFMSVGGTQPNTLPSGTLTLATPASFSKLSLLSFSTEYFSVLSAVVNFTDGTSTTAYQQTVADWFDGLTPVISGFGRIKRLLGPPYVVDGMITNNPRFYPFNISLSCTDQSKLVESITVTEISGGGPNSRGVILAVAGVGSTPMSVTPVVIPAACGQANGSASLDITGGTPLLSYEWNTTPVQLTQTATNLPAGTYTCTVTDGNLCTTLVPMTVTEKSVVKLKATARPGTVCSGSATTLSAIPTGGIIMHYTWLPGNINDSTTSISPADTTTYVVTGEDFFGCFTSDSIKVSVIQRPAAPLASSISICPDSLATLSVLYPDSQLIYNWYPYPSGGDILGTGDIYTTPPIDETTTWYVEAVTGPCSSDRVPVTVTPFDRPVTPVVVNTAVTTNSAAFSWKSIPGATGYLISIDGGAYITVTDTFYNVTGLQQETVSIRVISLGTLSCQTSLPGQATAKLKPGEVFIPNAFTPNGDGKNDIFKPEGNIRSLDMKIFNQWGELIATGSGWNGTSGGKAQPTGVYMYTMKIIMTNGTEVIKKGAVNLLR
ncbi:gliding motility-associated C-terminal domain-containing protein [Chitinophaga sp. YR573]|uniref:gliding motility-associated C-terminal domain-containing protein n=1 Tax=Chitinophaga sp. YR573 TaxID=1881040 RepID=UPI0008D37497|nr:gliding motility-associated C-terminal domain-containing protein [Chitinophaga sp. YR573]SEW34425.1 gliding motility-associated C-terminal domain-containing protein [Chitinophaga sp. YR573]